MRRTLVTCFFALAIVVTACGNESEPTVARTSSQGSFPATITAANGSVTIPARPRRIVSLSPTATEMLFAIGAGPQIAAVDDQSNYPPSAPKTRLSGFTPNVEATARYDPDLVIFANDSGGTLTKSFRNLKIPPLLMPAAQKFSDAYAQIEQLGTATGRIKDAKTLVGRIRTDIGKIRSDLPRLHVAPTYYHELDNTYFTVTSKTFIGQAYSLVGLRNIADRADKAGSGYPQMSAEAIIDSDPDFIFLADGRAGVTPAKVAKRPGWDRITAVREGRVISVDEDVASRWGPRIVDFLRTVARAVGALSRKAS